jgi:hypothetical protein
MDHTDATTANGRAGEYAHALQLWRRMQMQH